MCIVSEWQLLWNRFPVLSLMHSPWPLLRATLIEACGRAAVQRVAAHRASLGPGPRVDWALTLSYPKSMDEPSRALMRALHAGGIITPHELENGDLIACGACRECGAQRADLRHLLWVCPAFSHIRCKHELAMGSVNHLDMPVHLALHGLSPELSAASEGPLWLGEQTLPTHFLDEFRCMLPDVLLHDFASAKVAG